MGHSLYLSGRVLKDAINRKGKKIQKLEEVEFPLVQTPTEITRKAQAGNAYEVYKDYLLSIWGEEDTAEHMAELDEWMSSCIGPRWEAD